jgi:hypothetical protein
MKSQTVVWMLIVTMWMGWVVVALTYHYSHICPKEECCVTVTYYPKGCHLESCSKKHTFPCKNVSGDITDYNFTLKEPAEIIKVNYYKK